MAYCTVTQVAEEFKDVSFDAGTTVTDARVTRFIEEAGAEIDSVLSRRYQVPITGTNALIVVRQVAIGLVAGRVKEIMRVKASDESKNQEGRGGDTASLARKLLSQIATGDVKLIDAIEASADQGVRSFVVSEGVEHLFKRGEDQW